MKKQRVTSKTAYHHGDLRDQLIRAARRLIAEKGPEQFKVAEACRLAGVSTAAPYRHFAERQDILEAVAIDGMQRLGGRMREEVAGYVPGSHEAIAAIGQTYVAFAESDPHIFRLMFGMTLCAEQDEALSSVGRQAYEVLLHQVALFMDKNEIDEEVVKAGFPLWTFVHGLSFLLIDDNLKVNQMPLDIGAIITTATKRLLPTGGS